jgi:hypothetical protein
MLRSIQDLIGYDLLAEDGRFGKISDLYFDDEKWAIRFVEVSTGEWLPDSKVLIPLPVLGQPDPATNTVTIDLTAEQVMFHHVRGIIGKYAPYGEQ